MVKRPRVPYRKRLQADVSAVLNACRATLVSLEVKRGRTPVIRIAIDHPQGVTVRVCQQVTRLLLTRLQWFERRFGPFRLEVSSPGIDRVLKNPREFRWACGRKVRVRFQQHAGRSAAVIGILADAGPRGIQLKPLSAEPPLWLDWADIHQVRLAAGPGL